MSEQLWDKKAQKFPRFEKNTKDTLEILDFFRAQGVVFKDKHIVDIGAGNGRFALELAFEARAVDTLDFSQNMLDFLQTDAHTLGLHNIRTFVSKWEDFDVSLLGEIDIAFASMTPALNTLAGFKKALSVAKEGLCYVGWGRVRQNAFLDEIFALHHISVELPVGLPQVLKWLEEFGYKSLTHCYKDANFTRTLNTQEAIEDIQWHIAMHQAEPHLEQIQAYVESKQENGVIVYEQKREIGLCFIPPLAKKEEDK